MTNPISNNISISDSVSDLSDRVERNASQTQESNAETVPPVATTDQVTLTSDARRLGQVLKTAESEPQVDATKVASLREAIESGQFNINPDRIASRLLEIDGAFKS